MPSIGWSEMLMLAVVAIVVVGPKELPRLMRVVGHWMNKARAAASEFQQAFDDLARESEVEEMRRQMRDLRRPTLFPNMDDPVHTSDGKPDAGGDSRQTAPSDMKGDGQSPAPDGIEGGNGSGAVHAGEKENETSEQNNEEAAGTPETRRVPSH